MLQLEGWCLLSTSVVSLNSGVIEIYFPVIFPMTLLLSGDQPNALISDKAVRIQNKYLCVVYQHLEQLSVNIRLRTTRCLN